MSAESHRLECGDVGDIWWNEQSSRPYRIGQNSAHFVFGVGGGGGGGVGGGRWALGVGRCRWTLGVSVAVGVQR